MRPNPTYCPIKVPRRHVRYAETFVRATLYVSPYLVATPKGYTKHYYAESERVASRTGAGMDSVNLFLSNLAAYRESSVSLNSPVWQESWTTEEDFLAKYDTIEWQLDHVVYECLWTYPNVVFDSLNILYSYANLSPYQHENEPDCYWYHPDHLGSSSWITYTDGSAVQHLHYLPWGEDFVDQRSTNWNAMYTFSAKEKDTETGYSYFGSRYYSSALSIWLSVDPMSDKYPSMSPYVYCANNPVKLVDPNGEEAGPITRIRAAQSYLGTPYRQEHNNAPDYLRTANTILAKSYMDCSELVCRVMAADKITKKTESHSSSDLVNILGDQSKYIESDTPQEGDIVAWKGHAGIVESYDEKNQKVTVLHATRYKTESGKTVSSVVREDYNMQYYKEKGAKFYRPINENPDYVLDPVIIPATEPQQ